MRRLILGIATAAMAAPACLAQAPSPTPAPAQPPAQAPTAPIPPPQPVETQTGAPAGMPVFVIYPSNPPSRTTILLNTLTGETWLLGVNGPGGQYQWTRIAVADPSELAAAPQR